jgi:hypothetical protein
MDKPALGGHVTARSFIPILTIFLSLSLSGNSYCYDGPSYEETVTAIKDTMTGSPSSARKESYGYIRFDKCLLDYKVSGTYPAGGLYDIKYSDVDFSTLNYQVSKVGHDYTAFIILNFDGYFQSKGEPADLTIRTLVVNVSDDERAQLLFKAFLHLGELCAAPKVTSR